MEPSSAIIDQAYECTDYIGECAVGNISLSDKFRWENMKATAIPEDIKIAMFEIFSNNMKSLFEKTWGWIQEDLWNDMFSDKSCFLIIFEKECNVVAAFCHFQVRL
jgi:hypothetical protein